MFLARAIETYVIYVSSLEVLISEPIVLEAMIPSDVLTMRIRLT